MPQVAGDAIYVMVSAAVSAGDGAQYDTMQPQPPPMPRPPSIPTGGGSVSNPQIDMLEMLRRSVTFITTPSATLVSGGSAAAVAIAFGASGLQGQIQGVPFLISGAANTLSGAPTSLISTTSNQIRKVLVTVGMSALPVASSLANGGGTLQFVYGSAMTTSAGAVTSGGQTLSYFDYVPLPKASANEIPMGWINVVNSFPTSTGVNASHMFTDFRVTQGLNMSAMLLGIVQP